MATTKRRLNVSLSSHVNTAIKNLSRRDQVPEATKAAQLIQLALEIEEDEVLNSIVRKRDVKGAKFHSHAEAWA